MQGGIILRGNESKENYMEVILILKSEIGNVRSIDVARKMNFSKPSISKAMSILKSEKLITIDEKGFINFTEEGHKIAKDIYERHNVIKNVLIKIGVSEEVASEDACRIEHCVSNETVDKLKEFLNKLI